VRLVGCIYLDLEDILEIHQDQLAEHGGQDGVRNQSGLASAVDQPKATYGGEDLYPDLFTKASALAYSISEGQVFVDGNKRTGLAAALTFLRVNGVEFPPAEFQFYAAMIAMAKKEMDRDGFAKLLEALALVDKA
jgi:death-on-curing protein